MRLSERLTHRTLHRDSVNTSRPSRWRRKTVALAALLAVGLGSLSGVTFARWDDAGAKDAGIVGSGNLDIALVGPPVWRDTSAGVAGAPLIIDPLTRLATPGDTYTQRQNFQVTLDAENIRGRLNIVWPTAPSLPAGVTGTWTVYNASTVLATGNLGAPGVLDNMPAQNTTLTWQVNLNYATSKADLLMPATQTTSVGVARFELRQIRTGTGYN